MQYKTSKKSPYFGPTKRFLVSTAVFGLILATTAIHSKTAHASLISFVNSILGSDQASAQTLSKTAPTHLNSQNMPLLQGRVSINPTSDLAADTPPISDNETLVPDLAAMNMDNIDASAQISTYVVQQGDTISSVAKMFKVSTNTVLWANGLNGKSVLKTGQTLVILPITGVKYIVKKGDTIKEIAQNIAKANGANTSDIMNDILDYNDLTPSSSLSIGQSLIIPNGEPLKSSSASLLSKSIKIAPNEPLIGDIYNLPSYPGYYACPTAGRLSQGLHGRNAVDLAAPKGTPIYTSAGGTVIIAKSNSAWNGGYGNFVVISHPNNTQTLNAHMLKAVVYAGQTVNRGDVIGYVGMTGLTTGPHDHFEIRGARNPFTTISCL